MDLKLDKIKEFSDNYLVDLLDKHFTIDIATGFTFDVKYNIYYIRIFKWGKLNKDNFFYDNIKDHFIPFIYQLNNICEVEDIVINLGRSLNRNYYINTNVHDIINDNIEKIAKCNKRIVPNNIFIKIKTSK